MSIFKETINSKVSDSLSLRQELMGKENRTPQEISFLNSNTSWASLKSAINVDGKPDLAKSNVLEGGSLFFGKLRQGVGVGSTNAYSLKNTLGENNILGIRPMPGITSVTIENIGAYGSTRKATINYQCWDIKQLDVLEKLYMRPGYLALLEFGRTTYLQKENEINNIKQATPNYDFFKKENINLLDELKSLYKISTDLGGNYDAFLGYVVNYGWQVRDDGGYDCKTELISTGEILESLKTNYSLAANVNFGNIDTGNSIFKGLILPQFPDTLAKLQSTDVKYLNQDYSSNALAGIFREIYILGNNNLLPSKINKFPVTLNNEKFDVDLTYAYYTSQNSSYDLNPSSRSNVYITLDSLVNLINNTLIPHGSKNNKGALTKLSVRDREYINQKNDLLKCLYNILMISVDPDVCLIRNEYWTTVLQNINVDVNINAIHVVPKEYENILNNPEAGALRENIKNWMNLIASQGPLGRDNTDIIINIDNDYKKWKVKNPKKPDAEYFKFFQQVYQTVRGGIDKETVTTPKQIGTRNPANPGQIIFVDSPTETVTTIIESRSWTGLQSYKTSVDYLRNNFSKKGKDLKFIDFIKGTKSGSTPDQVFIKEGLNNVSVDSALDTALNAQQSVVNEAIQNARKIEEEKTLIKELGKSYQTFISQIPNNFVDKTSSKVYVGQIGNIYINLKYLYKLANDPNLKTQDPNEKSSISLSQFIKTMIKDVQASIGNVNNFELHIDDRDGIGRIIDLNHIKSDDTPFKFEIGSNKSIIRNLKLESKIFTDQSSMIAISAQGDSGKLGLDNSTLVAFNKGITDRLVPKKDSPLVNESNQINNLISSLSGLVALYIKPFIGKYYDSPPDSNFNANSSTSYKDYLRDIIVFITKEYNTDNKNSMFLPTQISFTLDGISGLVIGNLFTVDKTFIPKSYNESGTSVGYYTTKINHQIQNNDWTTTIEGIQYIPDSNYTRNDPPSSVYQFIVNYDPSTGTSIITPVTYSRNAQVAYDKAEKENPGFKDKVKSVAKSIGAAEMDLVKIMFIESAGTLNPGIKNSIGCVGLIQFCPNKGGGSTKTIGKKTYQLSQLQTMNRIQQMDVVQEYFQALGYNGSKSLSLTNMYLSTFYPVAVGKPGNFIIGSEVSNPNYKFTVATQNPGIAADSTTFISGKKVIDVNAVTKFINK